MSTTVGLRFRPVDENDRPSEPARAAARKRWSQALEDWPGVVSFKFVRPPLEPPAERIEVVNRANGVPPVDLTVVFETRAHADTLFLNSELVAELNGVVAGAHAVHAVGDPQVNGTPAELPR